MSRKLLPKLPLKFSSSLYEIKKSTGALVGMGGGFFLSGHGSLVNH